MILLMIKKKSKFLKIHKYRLQSWSLPNIKFCREVKNHL